jgi:tetratricopeptide (TPR) repeat protein
MGGTDMAVNDTPDKIQLTAESEDVARIARAVVDSLDASRPKSPWYLSVAKKLQDSIRTNWLLSTVALFILAWIFFHADPFYPIKKWAAVSKETNAQLERYEFAQKLSEHYVASGNALLNVDEFKDAEEAFKRGIECNPNSKEAEFGLVKSRLLSFSTNKEFDPQVIAERIALLKKALPGNKNADAHIAYAEARLRDATGMSPDTVVGILKSAIVQEKGYAAAQNLIGLTYQKMRNFKLSKAFFGTACFNAPFNTDYLMNCAYAYELDGKIDSAYEMLIKCNRIDPEIFGVAVEVLRFNTIYLLNYDYVEQYVPTIIEMFERDSLCMSPKNRDVDLIYSFGDSGRAAIRSWTTKRSYCRQLALFARYLNGALGQGKRFPLATACTELMTLWKSAENEKPVLPALLMNDLYCLAKCNADKVERNIGELRELYRYARQQTTVLPAPPEF